MNDKGTFTLLMIVFIIIFGISAACEFSNKQTQVHKIHSIDKVEKVHGDSDGFSTELYYMVTTDKGAYKITTEGFNAAPQAAKVQKDSTYLLTTRGIRVPFFGIYPKIIDVKWEN